MIKLVNKNKFAMATFKKSRKWVRVKVEKVEDTNDKKGVIYENI